MEATTASTSTATTISKPKRKKSKKSSTNSSAKASRASSPQAPAGFTTGDDFVPFTLTDDESPPSKPKKQEEGSKRRENSVDPHSDDARERRSERRDRDRKRREEGRKRERSMTPPDAREWDRGKRSERERSLERDRRRGEKRKYEDYDDEYANKKQRMDAASRKCPWVRSFDWEKCKDVADMLHQEVDSFVRWVSPTPVEDEIRGLVVTQITAAVKSSFPDAQVLPFGSYQTKLYLPLGDIDLVILSDSMAYSNKVTVLNALASTMRRAGITSTKVTIISKARVPIIKFVTAYGRFNVDISINQQSGVISGQIINGFLQFMHSSGAGIALRALVLVTKAFLSQRSMNEVFTGGLGSYSIVCLAVSFLQMHPKIRRGEIDPEKNLGVLVMEFFEYYGLYFNYTDVGISLRDGGTYFNKSHRGWLDPGRPQLLSIEDPAEPSNDISKGSYQFPRVRSTLAGAHSLLSTTAFLRAGQLNALQEGNYTSLRSRHTAEEMSILSCVMGITQETLNHRKLVQELYDSGTLHRIVGSTPQATPASSTKANKDAKDAVETVWGEADMSFDSEDEGSARRSSARRHSDDEEEDGRYAIERQQPPHKRRRTGKPTDDSIITFISDDDEDEDHDSLILNLNDGKDKEKREGGEHIESESRRGRQDQRRLFWSSKGAGPDVEDSE